MERFAAIPLHVSHPQSGPQINGLPDSDSRCRFSPLATIFIRVLGGIAAMSSTVRPKRPWGEGDHEWRKDSDFTNLDPVAHSTTMWAAGLFPWLTSSSRQPAVSSAI